uniref:Calponin-homology (CH) domain-containing protein n=1 Tax=Octopus bimaculoides TaxID=37653 RepID=A0A0L8HPV2_OCTBM
MSSVKTPFSVLHTPNLTNLKSYNSTEIQYKTVSSKRTQNKTISNRENTVPPSTKMVAKNRISPNQCTVKNYSSKKNDSVSCMNVNTNLELQTEYSVQEISSISKNVICVPYEDSPENKTIEIDNEVAVLTCVRNVTVESAESANEYQHSYVTTKRQKQMADEVIGPSFCKQSPRRETYLVKKQKRRSWKNKLKKSPTSSGSLPVVTSFSPPQLSPPHVYDNSIKNTTLSINSVSPIQTNFLLTSSPIESHHQTSACPNRSNLLLPNECSGNGFQDVCQREDREDNAKLEVLSQLGHPSELTRIEKQASPKSDNGLSSDSLNSRYSSPNSEIIYDLHQTPMLSAQDTSISRRSTHVIKEPKILCKAGALKKKSLFCCEKKPFPVGKIPVNCKVIRANTTPKNDRISSYKVRTAKRVTQSTEKAPCEKEKTVIPKHPMPFASKNIYYDERWMQKQEWSFTHWFNYILTPVEEYKIRKCVKVDAKSLLFSTKQEARLAPSKEVLSFEAYAARKRLNRLRKLSCKMFQTEDVVKVVQRLEVEIDSQRLVMRKDRPVHADIGLKQMILNWILSYNSLWLRIGLEMVFGEILLIDSNTDFLGLSRFIVTRLLGNPDIANRYAHPTVPHLYREGYQEALSKHTLKKYLILASKNLLYNIAREFLKGEGDVTRHLSYFGYTVSYVQTPLHEFDYAVSNLAVDLRDGIRLTRAVEILTGKWELTNSLRAPAISHLQKIHNVNKVLKALLVNGMDLSLAKGSICAKDIVDGHREKTLTLLWRIVTGFQVDILLDINELRDEVHFLKRCLEKKRSVRKLAGVEDYSMEGLVKPENEKHQLLFEWCQAVSAHYGLQIENFTVSFSDGRVLCYLIHHYYPGLLPLSEIKQDTTVTYINECENQQQDSDQSLDELAFSTLFSPKTGKPKIYEALLANEAENFKLIAKKVSAIGGVPAMLRHSDMSNTIPDEKVVITYITYLAIRLLEIRHEARAAIVIQMAWRKYLWCKKQRLRRCAIVIQRWYRNLQESYHVASDYQRMKSAVIVLQSFYRMYSQQRKYHKQLKAIRVLQAAVRMHQTRQNYRSLCRSTTQIQQWYRGIILCRKQRNKYLKEKQACIQIQSMWRGVMQRQLLKSQEAAAVVIQSYFRKHYCQSKYLKLLSSVILIQKLYRSKLESRKLRRQFLQELREKQLQEEKRQNNAAQLIQATWKCYVAQREFSKLKAATCVLQRYMSAYLIGKHVRHDFIAQKNAAVKIQSNLRGFIARRRYHNIVVSVTLIQALFRGSQVRKEFHLKCHSAVIIQCHWRAYLAKTKSISQMRQCHKDYLELKKYTKILQARFRALRKDYLKVRASVITIQSYLRKTIQERHFKRTKSSVIKIQQWYRACIQMEIERKNYCSLKTSTVFLQSVVQMKLQHKCFLTQRSSAIKIQRWYRILKSRRQLKETIARRHVAATCIQNWFKRAVAAKKYCRRWLHHRHQAATVIQSFVRGWLFRKCLAKQTAAAIVIQSNIRAFYARKLFEKKKSAILTIARYLQQYLKRRDHAAQLIQRVMRGWIVRKRVKKFHRNATLIQSYWRGYKVRCQSKRTITKLRQRLVAVTKEATEDKKLISRFAKGFDQLMKFKHLSDVLHALVNLEAASRLSPVCCLQLARENAIPVIYNIIKGCNRSVPHMELIKYSIQIFLNLAKYAPTIESVYHSRPDAIDIILNVMMVFREKGLVFSKSCILLGSIALDLKEKGKMDELLSRQKFVEKIMSLHKLTVWKYKQEEIRIVTRARLVAAKDACPFYENTVLSKIGPDWLLSKKKLQEFEEPLKAMTYLIYCLGLQDKLPKQLSKNLKM